jgi:predicted MFS family arabinose efflux permease
VTLYALILFTVLNHSVFMGSRVAISLYAIHLQASPMTVGVLISLYGLLPTLIAVSAGRLTDRVGPRTPLLIGSALIAAGAAVPCVMPGLYPLYASVTLIGLGFTVFQITVQNITGFIGKPEDRPSNFSILSLGYSVSAFVGPMLSGFAIDSVGYVVTFLLLMLLPLPTIAVLAANRLSLPRPPSHGKRNRQHRLTDLLAHRDLRSVFIISALQVTSWELFTFMMPIYGSGIGLSASVIGIIMGTFAVATFVVRTSLPYLSRRLTAWRLLRAALLIAAATFVVFPLVTHVAPLMALAFVLGVGLGAAQPMVMALLHGAVPEGRTGEAVGLRAAVVTTSQTVMPLLFGAIGAAVGATSVFWAVAAALIVGSRAARRRRPS